MPYLVASGVGVVITTSHFPGYILLVEENESDLSTGKRKGMLSVPAGHLKEGETLQTATIRETLEETGLVIEIKYLLGVYLIKGALGVVFLANAKGGVLNSRDSSISSVMWADPEEVLKDNKPLRPGMVEILSDYLSNKRYPVDIVRNCI